MRFLRKKSDNFPCGPESFPLKNITLQVRLVGTLGGLDCPHQIIRKIEDLYNR
jgi:hypothetical protein